MTTVDAGESFRGVGLVLNCKNVSSSNTLKKSDARFIFRILRYKLEWIDYLLDFDGILQHAYLYYHIITIIKS